MIFRTCLLVCRLSYIGSKQFLNDLLLFLVGSFRIATTHFLIMLIKYNKLS